MLLKTSKLLYHGQLRSGNPLPMLSPEQLTMANYMPNYYYENLLRFVERYETMGLENPFILIDTNHIKCCAYGVDLNCSSDLYRPYWNEKIKKRWSEAL